MASYWDEGIVSSIYHLQAIAAQVAQSAAATIATGGSDQVAIATASDYVTRAKALQTRAEAQWFPLIQSLSIKGDALQLGYELAKATGKGTLTGDAAVAPDGTLIPAAQNYNVLFDQDTTTGGAVGTPAQELAVGGDVTQNLSEFGKDLTSSASKLATNYGLPVAAKVTQLLYLIAALLVVLCVLFVYEKGKS
jgi:hypothetical protein